MTKSLISPQQAVEVLNRALAADPLAINALFRHRVVCNQALADDPTIQTSLYRPETSLVGLLGLLNGIFGIQSNGMGYLTASYEVVCPVHGADDISKGAEIDDPCPINNCLELLNPGDLIEFQETPKPAVKPPLT